MNNLNFTLFVRSKISNTFHNALTLKQITDQFLNLFLTLYHNHQGKKKGALGNMLSMRALQHYFLPLI